MKRTLAVFFGPLSHKQKDIDMDASTIQPRTDALATLASTQSAKTLENNQPAIETLSDIDQDDSSKVSNGTVTFSTSSLKLSASTPVQSSDQASPITNKDQAQLALKRLLADIQSNPSQALGAHSNAFSSAVKPLLG